MLVVFWCGLGGFGVILVVDGEDEDEDEVRIRKEVLRLRIQMAPLMAYGAVAFEPLNRKTRKSVYYIGSERQRTRKISVLYRQ